MSIGLGKIHAPAPPPPPPPPQTAGGGAGVVGLVAPNRVVRQPPPAAAALSAWRRERQPLGRRDPVRGAPDVGSGFGKSSRRKNRRLRHRTAELEGREGGGHKELRSRSNQPHSDAPRICPRAPGASRIPPLHYCIGQNDFRYPYTSNRRHELDRVLQTAAA